MKYKGIELKQITTSQIVDPPREMIVWSDVLNNKEPKKEIVYAVVKVGKYYVAITSSLQWGYCAEIPKELKPRQATNRELAKWLATGIGEYRNQIGLVTNAYTYDESESDIEVCTYFKVRKWDDTDWHAPTVDYMGIE